MMTREEARARLCSLIELTDSEIIDFMPEFLSDDCGLNIEALRIAIDALEEGAEE